MPKRVAASVSSPLLLIAQMLLLPVFLMLFLGSDLANIVELGPFLEAFLVLIMIPFYVVFLMIGDLFRSSGRARIREGSARRCRSAEPGAASRC